MTSADDYTVNIDADVRDYQQSLGKATSSTNIFTSALAAAGAQLDSLHKKADRKLTFMAAANVAGLTAATVAAARLEQQMSQLQARSVMTDKATTAYVSTVNNLRRAYGMTGADAISLVTTLNRLNVPFQNQAKTAEQYVKLSAVTGENVQGLAQSQQQFMRTMSAGQNQVGRYSSMIAQLNQNYGAGAQATLDFATNIAPLSKTMGMSTQQITGISAAFSKAGADGGAAANVYTKILSDINRAIQYGSPELQVYSDLLGTTVDQFKAMPKADAVMGIFDTLNKQGPDAIKTLERLNLEGVRSQRAIAQVMSQGGLGEGINQAQKGWNNTGPFNDASKKAMDGFLDQMSRAGQTFQTFSQGIGSTFLPALTKMGQGFNMLIAPLGALGDLMTKMPSWAKTLSAFALSAAALLPLLPKLITSLMAASVIPMIARGGFGQGFRLGRTPGGAISAAQRTYMGGGGNAAWRTLFGAGMAVGDVGNRRGRRGRLDDLEFLGAKDREGNAGERRRVVSSNAYMRDWMRNAMVDSGVVSQDFLDQREAGRPEREAKRTNRFRRVGGGAIGFMSSLAHEQLRPWSPQYLRDSGVSSERNKFGLTSHSRWRDALSDLNPFGRQGVDNGMTGQGDLRQRGSAKPGWWTKEGYAQATQERAQYKEGREEFKKLRDETGKLGKTTAEYEKISKRAGREMLSFAGATARAGAGATLGVGAAGAKAGAGLLGRGIGAVAGMLGPVGIALGVGAGVYGLASSRKATKDAITGAMEPGTDNAPGAKYREALGEASVATTNYTKILETASGKTHTAATNMADALKVTAEEAKNISLSSHQIVDEMVKKGSYADVEKYAASMLGSGASPAAAEQLKYDVVARFGAEQGQTLLNSAGQNKMGSGANLLSMINAGNQSYGQLPGWLGGGKLIENQLWTSGANRAAGVSAAAGMGAAQAAGQTPEEKARIAQSQLAAYGMASHAGVQAGEAGSTYTSYLGGANQQQLTRTDAIMSALGATDDKSRKALEEALQDFNKRSEGKTDPKDLEKAFQDALTANLSGTTIGANLAQMRQQGGIYASPSFTTMGPASMGNLAPFGSQALVDRYRTTSAGRVATNDHNGQYSAASEVGYALANEGNEAAQLGGQRGLFQSVMRDQGGDLNKTVAAMRALEPVAGTVTDKFRQLVMATEAMAVAERQHARVMGGQTTLNERIGQGQQDYNQAVSAARANPDDPALAQKVEDARKNNQQLAEEAKATVEGIAMQYINLQHERENGEKALARTKVRMDRDYNLQREYAEADFNRQRSQGQFDYNLQRGRAEADFARQRKRSDYEYKLQTTRSREDFNRGRVREEQDYNTQVKRMQEDSAKQMYDVYHRVTVQRTWDAENLLQNMADQQKRMEEQTQNLANVRKMGLSDAAISQLGLNESANAQQLERLMQGLQNDPKLVAQYNKAAKDRTTAAGDLMKDQSNEAWKRMEEDRKKNTDRQLEDYERGLDRSNSDYRRSSKQQREDFNRQMTQSQEDFTRSMNRAGAEFDLLRTRQRKNMAQGWKDMREDFDYQLDIQEENISFFATQTSLTFDEAFDIVNKKVSGQTKVQIKAMKGLLKTFSTDTATAVHDLDTAVHKPYDEWKVPAAPKNPVPGSQGGYAPNKPPGTGGPNDNSSGASTRSTSGGDDAGGGSKRVWPTNPHRVGTPWGKRGNWKGSRTLGPGYHSGVDFPNPTGKAIHAAADGTVSRVGWDGAYGNLTDINHGNGVHTWYAHQSGTRVKRGDEVKAGDHIGAVGETGRAFGTHLHLELVVGGKDKNPIPWLKGASAGSGGGGGGGGGGDIPVPDFANMKEMKAFEALIGKWGYLDNKNRPFHPGYYWKKGQLGKAIADDFRAKTASMGADYSGGGGTAGDIDTGGKGGARGVWNALRTGGLTEKQAAGVMGNIDWESNFRWNVVQGGGTSSSPRGHGSRGYGLVQWTPGSKLADILKKGNKKNSLAGQIWALFHQLSGKGPNPEGAAGSALRKAHSVLDATRAFMLKYERPGDQSESVVHGRNKRSEKWYKAFHGDDLPSSGGGGGGGNAGRGSYGHGMSGAKKAGQHYNASYITRHSDPRGKPSYDMGVKHRSQQGDDLAAHLRKFRSDYGLDYLIWNMRIASPKQNWAWRKYSPITGSGDFHHYNHVHSTYQTGTPSARRGWALVGEGGPEMVRLRGGEQILNNTQSKHAIMAAHQGQTVSPGIVNNSWTIDRSVTVEHATVVSNDPSDMLRKLEAEARMAALTKPKKAA